MDTFKQIIAGWGLFLEEFWPACIILIIVIIFIVIVFKRFIGPKTSFSYDNQIEFEGDALGGVFRFGAAKKQIFAPPGKIRKSPQTEKTHPQFGKLIMEMNNRLPNIKAGSAYYALTSSLCSFWR